MWIKAQLQKPEDMEQVWVNFHFDCPGESSADTSHQGYAIWSDEDGWYFDVSTDATLICRKYCEENGLLPCTITHWMKLPDSPVEE